MSDYYVTNYRRFAELLVYILSQLNGPVNETKVLKLLYFADAEYYARNGSTISGNVTYYKNHFGPTPNYNILKNIYDSLSDYLSRDEKQNDGYKSVLIELQNKDFTYKSLSAAEIAVIDETLAKYSKLSLSEVVKLAHFDPPYLASTKHKKVDFSYVRFRKSDEDYESHLDEDVQNEIATDISIDSRKKLKAYARSVA